MNFNEIVQQVFGSNARMVIKTSENGVELYGVRIIGATYIIYPCTCVEFLRQLVEYQENAN